MPTIAPPQEGTDCPIERTGGVDYYRAVLGAGTPMAQARDLAHEVQLLDTLRGGKCRDWRFLGFEGLASPSLRWGVRGYQWLWETSGEAAPDTWVRMAQCGGRTTRLDVQTTLLFSTPQKDFGKRLMSLANPTYRPPHLESRASGRHTDSAGLWLGTVGERTDAAYWRVYDKGVEARTHERGRRWRIELEAKKSLAPQLVAECLRSPDVPRWSEERVRSSWKSEGYCWPLPEQDAPMPPVRADARKQPPASALLSWYILSVAPTIPRALNVFTVSELLDALGLGSLAIARTPNDGAAES